MSKGDWLCKYKHLVNKPFEVWKYHFFLRHKVFDQVVDFVVHSVYPSRRRNKMYSFRVLQWKVNACRVFEFSIAKTIRKYDITTPKLCLRHNSVASLCFRHGGAKDYNTYHVLLVLQLALKLCWYFKKTRLPKRQSPKIKYMNPLDGFCKTHSLW